MGELIFTFGYGGSLILLGLFSKFLIKKIEKDVKFKQQNRTLEGKEVNF